MLKLTDSTVKWLKDTAEQLKGSARRIFMAETVQQLGYGGASAAQDKLGWNRETIWKGKKGNTAKLTQSITGIGFKLISAFAGLHKNSYIGQGDGGISLLPEVPVRVLRYCEKTYS